MVLAQFESLKFEIASSSALLFRNLKISAECETDDQTKDCQQYVSAKNGKPAQITITAILNAALGIDVEKQVSYIMNGAQRSLQGYFYASGKKVFPFKLMMVKAETEEIVLSPSGKWVKANVNITLKQSTKDWITGGGGSSGGGGGGGSSSGSKSTTTTPAKKSTTTTPPVTTTAAAVAGAVAAVAAAKKAGSAAKKAGSAAKKTAAAVSAAAAAVSAAKKTASTVSKPKPPTTSQKARASAKAWRMIAIK